MVDMPAGTTQIVTTVDSEALWYWQLSTFLLACTTVSYTHLTLPTTPYV